MVKFEQLRNVSPIEEKVNKEESSVNVVEMSGFLFSTRLELREDILRECTEDGKPSMKKIENNLKYHRLQLVNKLLAEVEGFTEKQKLETISSKYATMKRIVMILFEQQQLAGMIKQQGLKQKSIRFNFAKYLENALCLNNRVMTSKEIKQLAKSVGYQVRNIGDFLKMVTDSKEYRIVKAGRGLYKAQSVQTTLLNPSNLFTFSSHHANLLTTLKGGE